MRAINEHSNFHRYRSCTGSASVRHCPVYTSGQASVLGSVMEWQIEGSISSDGRRGWYLHRCGEPDDMLADPVVMTEHYHSTESLFEDLEQLGFDLQSAREAIEQLKAFR